MTTENARLPDVEQPEQFPKIPTKSLPQMLMEVEDNIKAAVEAAGRAEEAAKSARQALVAATKASWGGG